MSDSSSEWTGPPSSVLGPRVAIDAEGPLPTISELGLGAAKAQAIEWHKQRTLAQFNDVGGALTGRSGARWVMETHALIGVVAEQILLAIELEAEKVITGEAINSLSSSTLTYPEATRAHYSRSLRFFAESQANAIVIALHSLANVAARSLEFDAELTPAELNQFKVKRADFDPGSAERSAWLSWTKPFVAAVSVMASTRSPEIQAVAHELQAISSESAIADLLELRNTLYHRWRGESPGVTGIHLGVIPAADVLSSGQAVSLGAELPPYQAEDALDEVVSVSRNALDAFGDHMEPFLASWSEALPK
ncbi:hypothetical protein JAAN108728_15240 [Janibacter anophelis]